MILLSFKINLLLEVMLGSCCTRLWKPVTSLWPFDATFIVRPIFDISMSAWAGMAIIGGRLESPFEEDEWASGHTLATEVAVGTLGLTVIKRLVVRVSLFVLGVSLSMRVWSVARCGQQDAR